MMKVDTDQVEDLTLGTNSTNTTTVVQTTTSIAAATTQLLTTNDFRFWYQDNGVIDGIQCKTYMTRGQLASIIGTRNILRAKKAFIGAPIVDNPFISATILSDSIEGLFASCTNLTDVDVINAPYVTDVSRCFMGCISLTHLPKFNSSSISDYFDCFAGCTSLPEIITTPIDISQVTVNTCLNMFDNTPVKEITVIKTTDNFKIEDMTANFFGSGIETVHVLDANNKEIATLTHSDTAPTWGKKHLYIVFSNIDKVIVPEGLTTVTAIVKNGHNVGAGLSSTSSYTITANASSLKAIRGTSTVNIQSGPTYGTTFSSGTSTGFKNCFMTGDYQWSYVSASGTAYASPGVKSGTAEKLVTTTPTVQPGDILFGNLGAGICISHPNMFYSSDFYYHGEVELTIGS